MVRKKRQYFSEDTSENRAYILAAVSDPRNLIRVSRFGVKMYAKTMPDGSQAWVHVHPKHESVYNGGRSSPWFRWRSEPHHPEGGRILPMSIIPLKGQQPIDRSTHPLLPQNDSTDATWRNLSTKQLCKSHFIDRKISTHFQRTY